MYIKAESASCFVVSYRGAFPFLLLSLVFSVKQNEAISNQKKKDEEDDVVEFNFRKASTLRKASRFAHKSVR